jgi:hypothetical protein
MRQFDVGSDQWTLAQSLREKEFARNLDMDKHSIDVWKDNINHRDRAYLDSRSDTEQRLEMERAVHEKNMEVTDLGIDAAENNAQSKKYWESSERMFNYATTHIDGFNEETGEFSWDAEQEMLKWFKDKYPGSPADKYETGADYKEGDPEFYKSFKQWAASEWKAATDGRLTNPYDKMAYDVDSSDLDDASKKIIKDMLSSPEYLAGIAGIEWDKDKKEIKVIPKENTGTINIGTGTGTETSGPVGDPGKQEGGTEKKEGGPEGVIVANNPGGTTGSPGHSTARSIGGFKPTFVPPGRTTARSTGGFKPNRQ